jgi:hypothetical protein
VAAVIHWQQQPLAAVLLLVSWQCNGSWPEPSLKALLLPLLPLVNITMHPAPLFALLLLLLLL